MTVQHLDIDTSHKGHHTPGDKNSWYVKVCKGKKGKVASCYVKVCEGSKGKVAREVLYMLTDEQRQLQQDTTPLTHDVTVACRRKHTYTH